MGIIAKLTPWTTAHWQSLTTVSTVHSLTLLTVTLRLYIVYKRNVTVVDPSIGPRVIWCYTGSMSDADINHFSVLLEEVMSQNKAILEIVTDTQKKVADLPTRDEFTELKQDVKVIRAAVTDLSRQVDNHEQRVTRLEAA